jgi:hypothetical protein
LRWTALFFSHVPAAAIILMETKYKRKKKEKERERKKNGREERERRKRREGVEEEKKGSGGKEEREWRKRRKGVEVEKRGRRRRRRHGEDDVSRHDVSKDSFLSPDMILFSSFFSQFFLASLLHFFSYSYCSDFSFLVAA